MSLQNLVNVIAGFVTAQSWSTFQVSFLLSTMSDAQKWTLTMTKNTFDFEITHPRDLTQKKKKKSVRSFLLTSVRVQWGCILAVTKVSTFLTLWFLNKDAWINRQAIFLHNLSHLLQGCWSLLILFSQWLTARASLHSILYTANQEDHPILSKLVVKAEKCFLPH